MDSVQDYNDNYSSISEPFSLSLQKDNASTYYGIQSVAEKSTTNDHRQNKNNITNDKIVPITFEWAEEESDIVYLTGNFCNWKQFLIMPKNDKKYSLTLPLPRGLHLFRFRINDVWKINKNYPIMNDGENENNYVDTSLPSTNTESHNKKNENLDDISENEEEEKDEEDNEFSDYSDSEKERERIIKKNKKIKKSLKKMKYSVYFPKKNNFSTIAPDLPYSYNYIFNLDVGSKQNNVGKLKYYEPKEKDLLGENCSYKSINVLPFVELNHVHSKKNEIKSNKYVLCSFFFRYRNKFSTFLYYKPANKNNKSNKNNKNNIKDGNSDNKGYKESC